MRRAAIGIGSNSTRLLVADTGNGELVRTLRLREGTRLFSGLENGELSAGSMARTANAVAGFVRAALTQGVDQRNIHIFATSATRDARNGTDFASMITEMTGIPVRILSGEEEAELSFRGGAGAGFCGLVDIGGGSTELVTGGGGRPRFAARSQLGAVRLFGEVPLLSADGLEKACDIARARIAEVWSPRRPSEMPAAWYAIGGTTSCLASLDMRLEAYDRNVVDRHALGIKTVENWARRLSKMTESERAALPGMLPTRADIIAHGAVVLWMVMEALGIERVIHRNTTNLDGYLLQIAGQEDASDSEDAADKVRAYYDATVEKEWERLERNWFEYEINRRFLDRYIQPGDQLLDAGGGPGRYTMHFAARGADVTLLDLSPANVAFAEEKARDKGLAIRTLSGDARTLDTQVEGPFDAVLLMGPLYHLLTDADRVRAVEACLRVLKPGGIFAAAFILTSGGMVCAARDMPESIRWEGEDRFYSKIIAEEDFAGEAFTNAFLIDSGNIRPFMERFPLTELHLLGSESITAPFHHQLMAAEDEVRAQWIDLAERLAERPEFLSFSEHALYIGRKEDIG